MGNMAGMGKMFDSVMNSGMFAKFAIAQGYYYYVMNFISDLAIFIFGTFLMDAILMTF